MVEARVPDHKVVKRFEFDGAETTASAGSSTYLSTRRLSTVATRFGQVARRALRRFSGRVSAVRRSKPTSLRRFAIKAAHRRRCRSPGGRSEDTRRASGRASRPSLVAGPRLAARARHLGVGRRLPLRLLADARARARGDGLAALGHKLGVVRGAAEPLLQSLEDACDAASIRPDRPRPRPPPRPAWRTDPPIPARGVVRVNLGRPQRERHRRSLYGERTSYLLRCLV